MKKTFYPLILLAVLFQSCIPEETISPDYIGPGFALGSAEKIGNVSFITTDDPYKVVMKNINFPDSVLGERVYAEGYVYKSNSDYDLKLDVVSCFVVPIKKAQIVENQSAINLLNNASVSFDNNRISQTGKYLNIYLIYYGTDPKKHSFDFLINGETEKFENNRVTINICHYNDGDNTANARQALYSLDLTKVLFENFTENFEIKFVYTENSQKKEVIISNIKKY